MPARMVVVAGLAFLPAGTPDLQAIANAIGYPAAALGILIESAGIPFPGETMLLAVAAYAAAGHLDIRIVALVGWIGAVVGADIGYGAGYLGGRPFVERFGRIFRLNTGHLAQTELFFTRHGAWAIVLARFVLGLRTWFSVLAGMSRMPFWRFQLFSTIGGLAWAIVISAVGYLLGNNLGLVERVIRSLGLGGLVVVVLAAAGWWWWRRRARQSGRSRVQSASATPQEPR
jgi:membrane protein DedA with SNARE-associated domain